MTEQEFEEIEISPEDEAIILEMSRDPEIYGRVRKSIAPSIFGYDDVKEALGIPIPDSVDDVRIELWRARLRRR